MKKMLAVLFITLLSHTAFSQDLPLIDFGLKAGGNVTWLRGLPLGFDRDGSDFGFVGGAWARVNVPVIGFFVQPEIVFSQTGGTFTSDLDGLATEISMSSLDIPIILGKRFDIGPLAIRLGAGPVFSNILSAKLENDVSGEIDLDDTGVINTFQINLQAGIGLDISKFAFDLRYIHGFSSIYDDSFAIIDDQGATVGNVSDLKISGFQATVGYKLF